MKQLQFVRDSQSFDSEHVKHLFHDQRQKHDVDLKCLSLIIIDILHYHITIEMYCNQIYYL